MGFLDTYQLEAVTWEREIQSAQKDIDTYQRYSLRPDYKRLENALRNYHKALETLRFCNDPAAHKRLIDLCGVDFFRGVVYRCEGFTGKSEVVLAELPYGQYRFSYSKEPLNPIPFPVQLDNVTVPVLKWVYPNGHIVACAYCPPLDRLVVDLRLGSDPQKLYASLGLSQV